VDFDKYQYEATLTALDTAKDLNYLIPGLAAEAGEVAGVYAKYIRDQTMRAEMGTQVVKELGDCLWFIAMIAEHMQYDLSDIAKGNLKKLQSRQQRGVLGGSGNDR
jgi:NTP pyrophosphatase (non-canonical NTP hydrolase)